MAEDLRLLYVALTRSVYHCSIGIAPLFRGTRKKQGETDLHRSALGYLVQGAGRRRGVSAGAAAAIGGRRHCAVAGGTAGRGARQPGRRWPKRWRRKTLPGGSGIFGG